METGCGFSSAIIGFGNNRFRPFFPEAHSGCLFFRLRDTDTVRGER